MISGPVPALPISYENLWLWRSLITNRAGSLTLDFMQMRKGGRWLIHSSDRFRFVYFFSFKFHNSLNCFLKRKIRMNESPVLWRSIWHVLWEPMIASWYRRSDRRNERTHRTIYWGHQEGRWRHGPDLFLQFQLKQFFYSKIVFFSNKNNRSL